MPNVDWAATGSMLQGTGTWFSGFALLVAAWVGANTFESWRRQELTGRKIRQAERILEAAYNARRGLKYVRSPFVWGYETAAAEKVLQADEAWHEQLPAKQKRLSIAQALYGRLNRTKDERDALDQCLPMARALFGQELEGALEKLSHVFWTVQVDIDSYIDDEGDDREFTAKIRRGMYDVKGPAEKVNETTATIDEAVSTIEDTCLPVLRGK